MRTTAATIIGDFCATCHLSNAQPSHVDQSTDASHPDSAFVPMRVCRGKVSMGHVQLPPCGQQPLPGTDPSAGSAPRAVQEFCFGAAQRHSTLDPHSIRT